MHLIIKLFMIIILIASLTACASKNIVNKIELVRTIGFDTMKNGVKSTALISNHSGSGQADLQLLDTKSNSIFEIMPKLNTKTQHHIEYGQLRMVLLGKQFSEKGIADELDSLIRDPKISSRLQLGVADGDASELLEIIRKSKEPNFLSDLIEQNIKSGNLPSMNLHIHLFNFYGEGRDMFLPRVIVERGTAKIDGLVLFRSDKKAAEIGIKDSLLLKMLIEDSKNGSYLVPLDRETSDSKKNDYILMKSIHSKARYIIKTSGSIPSISIHLRMLASITFIPSQIDLGSQEALNKLEKTMGLHFEKEIQKLLSFCKENQVDPIGLGDFIRSRSMEKNALHFEEIYPEIKTDVSVEVKIADIGVGE